MSTPSIIKQQLLYTNTAIVWSWGVSKWVAISDTTLALRVNARRLNSIICITLDKGMDLYNLSFFKNKRFISLCRNPVKTFRKIEGVYCDALVGIIDDIIEKIPEYRH